MPAVTVARLLTAFESNGPGGAPGRWIGEGSARLGLSAVVAAEDLRAVLDGRCPATGRSLIAVRRPDRLPHMKDARVPTPDASDTKDGFGTS